MNRKKLLCMFALIMAVCFTGIAGCGDSGDDAGENAAPAQEETDAANNKKDAAKEDPSEKEKQKELEESMVNDGETDEAAAEEGYEVSGEGYTATVRWCKNGEKNIFGMLYVPEDYDGSKTYPTVIMSHGFGDCHTAYDAYAPKMAAQGMVCYTFDFCTGTLKCLSDGEQTDYSVITETEDLKAVMDFVKSQPCVDTSRITMMGQSMGGLVTSLVAAERADEIANVVLFYPGLMAPENLREEYPTAADLPTEPAKFLGAEVGPVFFSDIYDLDVYGAIGNYTGPVLLLHGTADKLVPVSVSEKALEVYENAELKVIKGGNHGFPPLEDGTNVREIAYNYIMEFLENR